MRVAFFGTPGPAVPALRALLADARVVVPLVVTNPDRPRGRGHQLAPPPVKVAASEAGVDVIQPRRASEAGPQLAERGVDVCAVVAYGQILPSSLLAVPPHGFVNLHFSVLPAWRGAAPVPASILAGDRETGVTCFVLDAGMDTGPVLATRTTRIGPSETSGELTARLADLGAPLLVEAIVGEGITLTLDGIRQHRLGEVAFTVAGYALRAKFRDEDGSARRVGCTARITEVTETFDDGRMNVVVTGEEPFKVLDRFEAEVLAENSQMVRVFRDAGYQVSREFADGVLHLEFDIDPTERSMEVQRLLGFTGDAVDGFYGRDTAAAVEEWKWRGGGPAPQGVDWCGVRRAAGGGTHPAGRRGAGRRGAGRRRRWRNGGVRRHRDEGGALAAREGASGQADACRAGSASDAGNASAASGPTPGTSTYSRSCGARRWAWRWPTGSPSACPPDWSRPAGSGTTSSGSWSPSSPVRWWWPCWPRCPSCCCRRPLRC